MGFHLDVGTVVALAAGVAMLGLAAALLVIDFGSRVHRAFALFLLLRGLLEGSIAFTEDVVDLAGRLRVYLLIAVPFAVLWFALVYRWRYSGRPVGTASHVLGGLGLLLAVLVVESLYLLDHGLYAVPVGNTVREGPLLAFAYLPTPAYAALALTMMLDGRRRESAVRRTALLLAAFALSVEPAYYATFRVADVLLDITIGGEALTAGLTIAELVAYTATLLLLAAMAAAVPASTRRDFLAGWSLPFGSALGVAACFAWLDSATVGVRLLQFFQGIWSLALPLVMAYALVRHRLFDVDVKLRFAVKGTTVAGAFLAVFFVASQLAQNFLSTKGGLVVGGIITGLVLFAINPIQHLADRIARRAVPATSLAMGTPAERVQIYREQLELAWADGHLTAKERLLFQRLQERLGIAADEAARLETEVLTQVSKAAPNRAAPA